MTLDVWKVFPLHQKTAIPTGHKQGDQGLSMNNKNSRRSKFPELIEATRFSTDAEFDAAIKPAIDGALIRSVGKTDEPSTLEELEAIKAFQTENTPAFRDLRSTAQSELKVV